MILITHPACTEYSQAGHPERPERIARTVEYLKKQDSLDLSWEEPQGVDEDLITRVHSPYHLARLEEGIEFDADTPAYPDIHEHAVRSVAGTIMGLDAVEAGGTALVLLRPPGHHATADRAMGFCYLNQVAIAAVEARKRGLERVAVFDFDVHHGNGTEAILRTKEGIVFASVHQHPCFPGTGTESFDNCYNCPVLPLTPSEEHMAVLRKSLDQVLEFKPELLIVSAGFDAYKNDPIADELLEMYDFKTLGTWMVEAGVPHLHVLEGGYSDDLPQLIGAYLEGLATGES